MSYVPWCLGGRRSAVMVLLHLHSCCAVLSSSTHFTSYLPFVLNEEVRCMLFPSGCVQLQLNSCSDVQPQHTCHVRCPPRKMSQMAHQREDSMLYTWWPCTLHFTTDCLLGVAVVLGPSAMFTFVFCTPSVRCLDRHWLCFSLVTLDRHWWTRML